MAMLDIFEYLKRGLPWEAALLNTQLLGGVASLGSAVQGHGLPGDQEVGHASSFLLPRLGEAWRCGERVRRAGEDEAGCRGGERRGGLEL